MEMSFENDPSLLYDKLHSPLSASATTTILIIPSDGINLESDHCLQPEVTFTLHHWAIDGKDPSVSQNISSSQVTITYRKLALSNRNCLTQKTSISFKLIQNIFLTIVRTQFGLHKNVPPSF